jgi:hypothetical protein
MRHHGCDRRGDYIDPLNSIAAPGISAANGDKPDLARGNLTVFLWAWSRRSSKTAGPGLFVKNLQFSAMLLTSF